MLLNKEPLNEEEGDRLIDKHDSDGDIKCCWWLWNCPRKFVAVIAGTVNQRKNQGHLTQGLHKIM